MTLPALYRPRAEAPWGDYGQILVHGMTMHAPRRADGLTPLERTGPFVPPVTCPHELLVTGEMRARLEGSGLSGLSFAPVHKTRIVRSDWEHWDHTADDPRELPESGEPEDYVLGLPHDEALAREMPDLYAIVPTGRARFEKRPPPPPDPSIPEWVSVTLPGRSDPFRVKNPALWSAHSPVLVIVEHDGSDLALAPPYEIPILSERAKDALASPWLDFEPIPRED